MDEDSNDDLFERRELRKKKDKKRKNTKDKEKDECSKESFKKMKAEIDELRKQEVKRQRELDELKRKIEEKSESPACTSENEYALDFDKNEYLMKGFIESAKWIKTDLAVRMRERMNEPSNMKKFESAMISKSSSIFLGIRTCARFNRGEECNFGRWHTTHKPDWLSNHAMSQQPQRERKNEMRLHVCTLCMEVFGSAHGHSLLNCPWIFKKNWK